MPLNITNPLENPVEIHWESDNPLENTTDKCGRYTPNEPIPRCPSPCPPLPAACAACATRAPKPCGASSRHAPCRSNSSSPRSRPACPTPSLCSRAATLRFDKFCFEHVYSCSVTFDDLRPPRQGTSPAAAGSSASQDFDLKQF